MEHTGMDKARIAESFEAVMRYARIIRDTQAANGFCLGEQYCLFRPDDYAFTITFQKEDRRLTFAVNRKILWYRVEREPTGAYRAYEGEVLGQEDTWMLLRWLDTQFPPQLPEKPVK